MPNHETLTESDLEPGIFDYLKNERQLIICPLCGGMLQTAFCLLGATIKCESNSDKARKCCTTCQIVWELERFVSIKMDKEDLSRATRGICLCLRGFCNCFCRTPVFKVPLMIQI